MTSDMSVTSLWGNNSTCVSWSLSLGHLLIHHHVPSPLVYLEMNPTDSALESFRDKSGDVCVYVSLCDFCLFSFAFTIWFGVLSVFFSFFLFFLPFLPSHVAGRVLVLWPGIRPEPPRWESRDQDIGPPETSWPCESPPRDLQYQLHPTASKLQCWTPHVKQLTRQEHNPTH